ncbi:hypothetical protein FRC06_007773 [Ceratobasidium sp. 370]|nr:hypothetical protein FRC06_007773 [Ceratobasidium sp. 370]
MDPTPDSFFTTIGKALSQLHEAVVNRTIDKGQQGELVSRIVFLMGKDVAIRALHATPTSEMATDPSLVSGELLDCKPLPVIRYLTTLFGGNAIKQEHLDLFDGWYINFSHWIGMTGNIALPGEGAEKVTKAKEWLLCHWKRTSALQCCHGQPSIDKIIPIYKLRRPSERRLSRDPDGDRVSFIVIQDKNRDRCADSFAPFNISPETAGIPRLGHPYIAILADLGAGDYELACGFDGCKNVLAVHAFGASPSTYKFLKGTAAHNVREILEAPHSQDGGDISSGERKLLRQIMFGDFAENY